MAELTWERMGAVRAARLGARRGVVRAVGATALRADDGAPAVGGDPPAGVRGRADGCAGWASTWRSRLPSRSSSCCTADPFPIMRSASWTCGAGRTRRRRSARWSCRWDEAEKFHAAYPIGTEHILLGLLAIPEGMGCGTLAYFGVDYANAQAARDEIWELLKLTE